MVNGEREMADELFKVPLFPLNVVLFPGMALPLHIFEPRYRDMTADCLADQAPFGVVLAVADENSESVVPARVGTLARIADYERLPDGRYNMLALGTSRFEVIRYQGQIVDADEPNDKTYLVGIVRPLRDYEDSPSDLDALVEEARSALDDYLHVMFTLVGSEDRKLEVPREAGELSYLIGMCLMCEDCEKQQLLETTSLPLRLRTGIRLLRAEVEDLGQQVEHGIFPRQDADRSLLN
jgi:Lon protease-like protein